MFPLSSLLRFFLGVSPVFAQAGDPCAFVPGGCSGQNVLYNIINPLATLLISIAAGAAVLGVIVGGAMMVLNFGDESKVEKGRQAVYYSLGGFVIVLAAQAITTIGYDLAGGAEWSTMNFGPWSNPVVELMRWIVGAMLTLFNVVFVIVIMAAGYRLILARGQSEEYGRARTMVIWAIVGAIVINASYALVNVIINIGF